jgi:hypothetical protein
MSGLLKRSREAEKRRARLVKICESLPDVEISGKQHLAFRVRGKTFAYYLYDHHGDGRIALSCKAPPGEQRKLVEQSPANYFVPPYLGPRGWVALRLDLRHVDWGEVVDLVVTAYRLIAPRRLVALVYGRRARPCQ